MWPRRFVASRVRKSRNEAPQEFDAFAVAAPGVAPLVANELRTLHISVGEESPAGVAFRASAETLLHANLWSRLTTRFVVRLANFTARDFATLEKQGARVPWTRVIAPGVPVRFRVTCRKSRLYHSDAVAERLARAVLAAVPTATILERARGDDDADDDMAAEQLILVRIEHDHCVVSADSSGALLHRRGWRQAIAKAPLRETLAAAMLTAVEWTPDTPLVDPFCGSGTIGIEAALRARNIAPGLQRSFVMEQWPEVDAAMVTMQRAAARAQSRPSTGVPIVLTDRDAGACEAAVANAERAGVLEDIEIDQCALSEVDLSSVGERGLVLTNPPYGLRISDGADLRGLYARLGDVVRAGGRQWRVGMLVPDQRFALQTGLRFAPMLRTKNGGIETTLELSKPAGGGAG